MLPLKSIRYLSKQDVIIFILLMPACCLQRHLQLLDAGVKQVRDKMEIFKASREQGCKSHI